MEIPVPADQINPINQLDLAHKVCTNNKLLLEKSTVCGCFVCRKIFKVHQIIEWNGNTAKCPYCWVDTVVPQSGLEITLTVDFLNSVYNYLYSPLKNTK
jgi:hypothetical protein